MGGPERPCRTRWESSAQVLCGMRALPGSCTEDSRVGRSLTLGWLASRKAYGPPPRRPACEPQAWETAGEFQTPGRQHAGPCQARAGRGRELRAWPGAGRPPHPRRRAQGPRLSPRPRQALRAQGCFPSVRAAGGPASRRRAPRGSLQRVSPFVQSLRFSKAPSWVQKSSKNGAHPWEEPRGFRAGEGAATAAPPGLLLRVHAHFPTGRAGHRGRAASWPRPRPRPRRSSRAARRGSPFNSWGTPVCPFSAWLGSSE